jgi:hypothetical protein
MSIFKQEKVWRVQYHQLDDFINEHFKPVNGEFEILAYEELGNDCVAEFNINIDNEFNDYDKEQIKKGNFMFQTTGILNELSRKGILPMTEGKIIVEVSY